MMPPHAQVTVPINLKLPRDLVSKYADSRSGSGGAIKSVALPSVLGIPFQVAVPIVVLVGLGLIYAALVLLAGL